MNKSIKEKERELYSKWTYLRKLMYNDEAIKRVSFELSEAEDKAYKEWVFFKKYANAMEELKNEKTR